MRRNAVGFVEDVLPAAELTILAVGRRTRLKLIFALLAVLLIVAHPKRWDAFAFRTLEHSTRAWRDCAVSERIYKNEYKEKFLVDGSGHRLLSH
jgi:hypothetical protein